MRYNFQQKSFALFLILGLTQYGGASEEKKTLLNKLFENYDTLVMPVENEGQVVNVSVGMTLMQLVELDQEYHTLEVIGWLQLQWKDAFLTWDPSQFGNISSLELPMDKIWFPDIYVYNHNAEKFDPTHKTHVVVKKDGSITFIGPGNFKTICRVKLNTYPVDQQECEFKLGSWVHSGSKLDLNLKDGAAISLYNKDHPMWDIKAVPAERNVKYYPNYTDPFIDVVFKLILTRNGTQLLFYCKVINFFIVSLLILSILLNPSTQLKIIFPLVAMVTSVSGIYTAAPTDSHVMYDPPQAVSFFFQQLVLCFIIFLWNVSIHFVYYAARPMPYWFKNLTVEGRCMQTWLRPIVPETDEEKLGVGLAGPPGSNRQRLDSTQDDFRRNSSSGDMAHLLRRIETIVNGRGEKEWRVFAVTVDRLACFIWIFVVFILSFFFGLPSPSHD